MTAFALIIVGGTLMFAGLALRGRLVPAFLSIAVGLCGVVTTTAGALRL